MQKYICILLLAVVLTNAQDLPWAGNYTVIDTININGTDISQCCVPSALNIAQDQTNAQLLTIDLDFGAGSAQCDATLLGMINMQQEANNWGRVILNDSSTTLNNASLVYLLNNGTILLMLSNGCYIHYGTGTATVEEPTNLTDRYQGIWVREVVWSSDPDQPICCSGLQPIANAYDDFTQTEAYVHVYSLDEACPAEVRGKIQFFNDSVAGGAVVGTDFAEFMAPNGSTVLYNQPPYCNSVWTVKKPTLSTNLCDYVDNAETETPVVDQPAPVVDETSGGV
jgi:hypothetical protein